MTRPVRVTVVAPRFPPDVGGMERYVGWVAASLQAAPGFEVSVVSTHPGRGTRREDWRGIPVVRLGTWLTLSNTPVSPWWPHRLRRLLDELGTDVVNAHAPVPYLADVASVVSGPRPVVLTYHAGSLLKGGGAVDVLLGAYERHVLPRVMRRCAALVAVSPVSMAARTGRASMVTPGVDTAVFHPPPAGADRGRRVVYVGRIEATSRWKGLHVLVDALPALVRRCPDVVVDLVGGGDGRAALEEQARRLGVADRLVWHGSLPAAEVAERHRRAAVAVLPSLTESESFGMALVEAMACATPVVASRVGGPAFVVRDGVDGLLVPPGDADRLADALGSVLTDPALAVRLGAAGRAAAEERWDARHQVETLLKVLRSVAPAR